MKRDRLRSWKGLLTQKKKKKLALKTKKRGGEGFEFEKQMQEPPFSYSDLSFKRLFDFLVPRGRYYCGLNPGKKKKKGKNREKRRSEVWVLLLLCIIF